METGPLVEGLRVVRAGLAPTDRVVLDGLARMQPGATVRARLTRIVRRAPDDAPNSSPLSAPAAAEASAR